MKIRTNLGIPRTVAKAAEAEWHWVKIYTNLGIPRTVA